MCSMNGIVLCNIDVICKYVLDIFTGEKGVKLHSKVLKPEITKQNHEDPTFC